MSGPTTEAANIADAVELWITPTSFQTSRGRETTSRLWSPNRYLSAIGRSIGAIKSEGCS